MPPEAAEGPCGTQAGICLPYQARPQHWLTCSFVGGVAQLAERYVRNVEAEGSNPFTSTDKSGSEGQSGTLPEVTSFFDLTFRHLIGEKYADERYVSSRRGQIRWLGETPDSKTEARMIGASDGALGCCVSLTDNVWVHGLSTDESGNRRRASGHGD